QAEDGIRYDLVTGVQTCALPICLGRISGSGLGLLARVAAWIGARNRFHQFIRPPNRKCHSKSRRGKLYSSRSVDGCERIGHVVEIGRASCRERVWIGVVVRVCEV